MTRAEANRLLDRIRAGESDAPAALIAMALRATGDIGGGPRSRPAEPIVVDGPLPSLSTYLNSSTRVMREREAA